MRVPIGVPGGGRVQGDGGGAVFLWKRREKGKGVGRVGAGVGTGKGTRKSMRKLCRNYPLANYPLVSPRFSGDCDGFCDGLFGQEGRILQRIFVVLCFPKETTDFVTDFGTL